MAISLLLVHLFNIAGVIALRQYLVYKSDNFYKAQTGKNLYDINELTEIKILVAMPGIVGSGDYQHISGRVDFRDASYNYVQMKIAADGIYLKCTPNYSTTRLSTQNVISAKNIKDIPVPQKEHVLYGKMKVIENLQYSFASFAFSTIGQSLTRFITQPVHGLFSQSLDVPDQPPKSFQAGILLNA